MRRSLRERRRLSCPRGLIERWIDYKRGHEINPVRMRPHPIEFSMYFDA